MYLWQDKKWPEWSFDSGRINPLLKEAESVAEALLSDVGNMPESAGKEVQLDALIQSAIKTSSIEGEFLNVGSVRSSVAKQLGLDTGLEFSSPSQAIKNKEAGVVQLLTQSVADVDEPLTEDDICQWQSLLFPDVPVLRPIRIGSLRQDEKGAMQVVSEHHGQVTVHFEAPPASLLSQQLSDFLVQINEGVGKVHGLLRAAWIHLYFITLHPFDDGNGRMARALTDRSLWQHDAKLAQFCAMSAAIEANKSGYYRALEMVQNVKSKEQSKRPMDVTAWVVWFLETWIETVKQARHRVDRVLQKALFWKLHAQTVLSQRQVKVLNKILDEAGESFTEGLAARHYQAIAQVSKATATRDLADLVSKGALETSAGGGRSVRYRVPVFESD